MKMRGSGIDVKTYVAIGDSLTAGYADGALCNSGQRNSYPNLLAQQFKLLGGGNFNQPLIHDDSVGIGLSENSCLILKTVLNNSENISASLSYTVENNDHPAFLENCYSKGPFNNLGIPGVKVISVVMPQLGNPKNGEGNYNPFFTRIASDPERTSILSDAIRVDPTFFSVFIGSNDVLAYALSGGTSDNITPMEGEAGRGFKESYRLIVEKLMLNGAKGVLASLPDLSTVPYFNAIPYNGLVLDKNGSAELNRRYSSSGIDFVEGKNSFIIEDKFGIRLINRGEMILSDILLDGNKQDYLNGITPIPEKYFLNADKLKRIQQAVVMYNEFIKSLAKEKKLAFADINTLLKTARKERVYDSSKMTFNFEKNGGFSNDGVHPNALGQILLANEFISAINSTYSTSLPMIDEDK